LKHRYFIYSCHSEAPAPKSLIWGQGVGDGGHGSELPCGK